jgi:hypothetical protein
LAFLAGFFAGFFLALALAMDSPVIGLAVLVPDLRRKVDKIRVFATEKDRLPAIEGIGGLGAVICLAHGLIAQLPHGESVA